eukprot:248049-Hanusia_phi.AAC.2
MSVLASSLSGVLQAILAGSATRIPRRPRPSSRRSWASPGRADIAPPADSDPYCSATDTRLDCLAPATGPAVGLVEARGTGPGASSWPRGGDGMDRERGRAGETLLISAAFISDVAVDSDKEGTQKSDVVTSCRKIRERFDAVKNSEASVEVEAGPVRRLRDASMRELNGQQAQPFVFTEPNPYGIVGLGVEIDRSAHLLVRVQSSVVDD